MAEELSRIQKVIEGLQIFQRLDPKTTVYAEHDKIMLTTNADPHEDDRARVELLGWFEDDDGGWTKFV